MTTSVDTRTHGQKVQDTLGTASRNKAIVALFQAGMTQTEIARQITVRGHQMSRQQVNFIVHRMERNNGNRTDLK
jgi:hypothetical protein